MTDKKRPSLAPDGTPFVGGQSTSHGAWMFSASGKCWRWDGEQYIEDPPPEMRDHDVAKVWVEESALTAEWTENPNWPHGKKL
jgi:hypothetical protein